MAKFRIRYFTTRPGKQGKGPRYFWQPSADLIAAGWKIQRLSDNLQDARTEAERYNRDLDSWRANLSGDQSIVNAQIGSIEALINNYKSSRRWRELAPKTRGGYEYAFRIIRAWAADAPVTAITPRLVQMFYEKMRENHPAKAAAVVRVLRLLMTHAVREDMIERNPAEKPGISHRAKKGTIWTAAHVNHIVRTADALGYFSVGTAVMLNAWMGQRLGDVLGLQVGAYKNGCISKKQSKTGAEVVLPVDMVPALKARIDAQIEKNREAAVPSVYLLPAAGGQAYTAAWFSHLLKRIRDIAAAGGPPPAGTAELIFKDLRHTAVTRLAEAGAPTPMIASITGHSFRTCEEIVDRYNVRTSKMAEEAFRLRLAAEQPKKETHQ
ncbi:MAG: tyrosine-type recombinase/integrase [Alphaproteobacteria bacterium]|nr:tyrosine-type recombinase/integrase [Alphaproteobacteria bacterium]